MKLVIAEKPSLARSIMDALIKYGESFANHGEYFEGKEYLITSCFGHIFELCDIEDYITTGGWKLDYLPFKPGEYKFKVKQDAKKRWAAIKELVNSPRVSSIYNCGDADREGQIIIDIVLKQANNKKPVYRPWLTDQTEDVVYKAIKNARPNEEYSSLHDEGITRMIADWDYGINLTRYASIKTNSFPPLRVGRVKGAITNAIYTRDMEIKNFVPSKYYKLISEEETAGEKVKLIYKQDFKPEELVDAKRVAETLNAASPGIVKDIEKKDKVVSAPKLFSQSDLQNYLNKKYGFAPDYTLSLAQKLYEKKLTTYPRTKSQYLTEDEQEMVKQIIAAHNNSDLIFKSGKRIFDSTKVEGHSAITPTTKTAKPGDFSNEDEQKCYDAILNRFRAVFWAQECIKSTTTMTIAVGDTDFTIKGDVVKQRGFLDAQEEPPKEKNDDEEQGNLPNLNKGDLVNAKFFPIEKETKPPKHYTVETLNNYLRHPFKNYEDNDDDTEFYKDLLSGLEIGTEATRAGIIKELVKAEYITLIKTTYRIAPKGEYLVRCMNELSIDMSPEKTVHMGKLCTDVKNGKIDIDQALLEVHNEVVSIISSNKDVSELSGGGKKEVGKCPRCNSPVIAGQKNYYCSNRDCSFTIWKQSKWLSSMKAQITPALAEALLEDGRCYVKGLYSQKKNKKFDAFFVLDDTGQYVNIKLEFE